MYALTLRCPTAQSEIIAAELWDCGIVALSEREEDGSTVLVAGVPDEASRACIDIRLAYLERYWQQDETDWVTEAQRSWPARSIGDKLYLAPHWDISPTPPERLRLRHNPGLASGTGEHPCTRLALAALERTVSAGDTVLDVGTGSGILAIAASRLGCRRVLAIDTDFDALAVASENQQLNESSLLLACGSADCIRDNEASLTVANIASTVLLHIWDDLLRVTRRPGKLILTGFSAEEGERLASLLTVTRRTEEDGWACLEALQQ